MFPVAPHSSLVSPPRFHVDCSGILTTALLSDHFGRPLFATDASLSGPSPLHGACGFSSAADTNRIRDDILPGWRGLSWSNWDGSRRDAGMEEAPLYVPLMWIFVLWFWQNYNWIDCVAVKIKWVPDVPKVKFPSWLLKYPGLCVKLMCNLFTLFPLVTLLEGYICEAWLCLFQKNIALK